jgi:hypothetical protein
MPRSESALPGRCDFPATVAGVPSYHRTGADRTEGFLCVLAGHPTLAYVLRPRCQWKDRAEPGGQEIIPGQPSMSDDWQDLGGVSGVRCRPHQAIEARRRRRAKYAMADRGGGKGQRQDRISGRSRRSLMAATIWACRQSV